MAAQFKPGVNFDVVPQIRGAVSRIESIFSRYGYIPVITSARDSTHSPSSLHYIGAAIDIRSKGLPDSIKQSIYSDFQSNFSLPTWFVDLESPGGFQEHFHLQYEPAKRADIDPYSVEPTDVMTTWLPMVQPEFFTASGDQGYIPDSTGDYPRYPSGIIPPQYFTPYELPVDWLTIILVIVGGWLFLELTE
jgi:hypothetical protein